MTYRLFIWFFWPLLFIYTLRLALRYKSMRYLQQRLGFGYTGLPRQAIWLHCASVGEVNTVLPLLKILSEKYTQHKFVISTNTCTGATIVERNRLQNVMHCFLPLDTVLAVNRFLNVMQPKLAIIVETELWPTLYGACRKKAVPVVIVNGRLSPRTLQAKGFIRKEYKKSLQVVQHVLARSAQDKDSYIELGATSKSVEVVGNLKFAQRVMTEQKPLSNFTDRAFVLAASTHDDEEYQLTNIWKQLQRQDYLLVIVPRHPERGPVIMRQLQNLQLNIALRSRNDAINEKTDVYIADTIGELMAFIEKASLVIMGGSLIARGGQNLLEPARLERPIIVGPHMENFQAEVNMFLEHQACVQVKHNDELAVVLNKLLDNPDERNRLARAASNLMTAQSGIAETYVHKLETCFQDIFS
ncbi:MAG TPA: 3-deoxy-D-manno-octulosonic acid transferase [Gammaproteobacteria bacterium]